MSDPMDDLRNLGQPAYVHTCDQARDRMYRAIAHLADTVRHTLIIGVLITVVVITWKGHG